MSEGANVKKFALLDLKQGIIAFRGRMHDLLGNVESFISHEFSIFEQQKAKLRKRLWDAENSLVSAENELREKRKRVVLVRFGPEPWMVRPVPADCSAEERKVQACIRWRDECKRKYERCERIIHNCRMEHTRDTQMRNLIENHAHKTLQRLDEHINDINDYHGLSTNESTNLNTLQKNDANIEIPINEEKCLKQSFFDNDGNPMINKKVIIYDNQVFGFGRIEAETDEFGQVKLPFAETNDCTIYIDGNEVYNGNLFENMEYNKYGDGKFVHNLESNHTSETERVAFEALDNRNIDVTHSLNIDENALGDVRREETFGRNSDGDLSSLKIEAVKDDKNAKTKEGWVKIKKEENE